MALTPSYPIGLILAGAACLSACADGAREASAPSRNFHTPLPAALHAGDLQYGDMAATLQVDGAPPLTLDLNWTRGQASGRVPRLSPGLHDFTIQFLHAGERELVLASARQNEAVPASGRIDITFRHWTYADDDGDGYTNLAEWRLGTDWWDRTRTPPRESLRVSGNYVLRDRVGGAVLSGDARSRDYRIMDD